MKRIAGVVALLSGAALTAAASNRQLYALKEANSSVRSEHRLTLWGSEYTSDGLVDFAPTPILLGVPVAVAAVLLAVSAVLVLASTRLPALTAQAARVGAVVAAALLVGSVWAIGQLVLASTSEVTPAVGSTIETAVGSGMWLLVAAAVVAVAGALLVQRRPVYQLPDDDDTDTPPMGIPIHPSVSTEESSPG